MKRVRLNPSTLKQRMKLEPVGLDRGLNRYVRNQITAFRWGLQASALRRRPRDGAPGKAIWFTALKGH